MAVPQKLDNFRKFNLYKYAIHFYIGVKQHWQKKFFKAKKNNIKIGFTVEIIPKIKSDFLKFLYKFFYLINLFNKILG